MAGMPPRAATTDAQTTAAPPTTHMFDVVGSESLSRNRYDTHVTIADGSVVAVYWQLMVSHTRSQQVTRILRGYFQ